MKPENSAKCKVQSAKCKAAFTLIELLVVITIIAILLGITTFSYTQAQKRGRDGKRKAELKAVQLALESYYQNNGAYPPTFSGKIMCNVNGNSTVLTWGTDSFRCDVRLNPASKITYLDKLPADPTVTPIYYYAAAPPYKTYTLYSNLENTSDPDYNKPGCVIAGRHYCVKNP